MGAPVVHFEIIGKNPKVLNDFYSSLFGWDIDSNNPVNYGSVAKEGNTNAEGIGIGGGVAGGPTPDYPGHVTFYVEVPSVEDALQHAEKLGGTRLFGPAEVPAGPVLGQFTDPEGHMIGLVEPVSNAPG